MSFFHNGTDKISSFFNLISGPVFGEYYNSEAKPILQKLIEKNPTNSEYHRVLGQILSDEGDQEEAINSLIDSLRWDSKNGWALLMMVELTILVSGFVWVVLDHSIVYQHKKL